MNSSNRMLPAAAAASGEENVENQRQASRAAAISHQSHKSNTNQHQDASPPLIKATSATRPFSTSTKKVRAIRRSTATPLGERSVKKSSSQRIVRYSRSVNEPTSGLESSSTTKTTHNEPPTNSSNDNQQQQQQHHHHERGDTAEDVSSSVSASSLYTVAWSPWNSSEHSLPLISSSSLCAEKKSHGSGMEEDERDNQQEENKETTASSFIVPTAAAATTTTSCVNAAAGSNNPTTPLSQQLVSSAVSSTCSSGASSLLSSASSCERVGNPYCLSWSLLSSVIYNKDTNYDDSTKTPQSGPSSSGENEYNDENKSKVLQHAQNGQYSASSNSNSQDKKQATATTATPPRVQRHLLTTSASSINASKLIATAKRLSTEKKKTYQQRAALWSSSSSSSRLFQQTPVSNIAAAHTPAVVVEEKENTEIPGQFLSPIANACDTINSVACEGSMTPKITPATALEAKLEAAVDHSSSSSMNQQHLHHNAATPPPPPVTTPLHSSADTTVATPATVATLSEKLGSAQDTTSTPQQPHYQHCASANEIRMLKRQLALARQEKEDAEQSRKRLETQLLDFESQHEEDMQRSASYAAALAHKRQSTIDSLQSRLEQSKMDKQTLQDQLHEGKQLLDKATLERDEARLQFQEKALKRHRQEMQQQQTQLSKEAAEKEESHRIELELLQADVQVSQTQLRQLQESNATLAKALEVSKQQNRKLELAAAQRQDQHQNSLQRLQQESNNKIETLEAENKELIQDVGRLTSLVEETAVQKSHLQKQLQASQSQLVELDKQNKAELETAQETSFAEIRRFQSELANTKDKLSQLTETVQNVQTKNKQLTQICNGLELAVQDGAIEESRLLSELEHSTSEANAARDKLHHIQDEYKTLSRESTGVENLLHSTQEELAVLQAISDTEQSIKTELDDKSSKLESAHDTIQSLREQQAQLDERLRRQAQEAATESATQQSAFESEISALKRQIHSLETTSTLTRQERDSLAASKKDLLLEQEKLRSELEDIENRLSDKNMECASGLDALEDLECTLRQTREELTTCRNALDKAHQQYSELSDRLSHMATESAKEKDSTVAELISIQDQLAHVQVRNGELEKLLRSMRRNLTESDTRAAASREQLALEREKLNEIRKASETSQRHYKERLSELSGEVQSYKEQIGAIETERNELQTTVNSLENGLNVAKKELSLSIEQVEQNKNKFIDDRESLQSQLSEQREQVQQLSDRLRTAKAAAEEAQREISDIRRKHEEELRLVKFDSDLKWKKQSDLLDSKDKALRSFQRAKDETRIARSELARMEESLHRAREETALVTSLLDEVRDEGASKLEELEAAHLAELGRLSLEKQEIEKALQKAMGQQENTSNLLYAAEERLSAASKERELLIGAKNDMAEKLRETENALHELRSDIEGLQDEMSESLDDSGSSEFDGLSRADLKSSCNDLREKLRIAEQHASAALSELSRQKQHMKQLDDDMKTMSKETQQLVTANQSLEDRLMKIKSSNKELESQAASMKDSAIQHEASAKMLSEQLNGLLQQNKKLCDDIAMYHAQDEMKMRGYENERKALQSEVAELNIKLSQLQCERDETISKNDANQQKLDSIDQQQEGALNRINELEMKLRESNDLHVMASQDCGRLRVELQGRVDEYSKQIESMQEDCSRLRSKIVELEVDVETKNAQLRDITERETTLTESLEKQREATLAKDTGREEAVSKLTEAARVVSSQKEAIKSLELRAAEADRTVSSLTAQTKTLQATIQKLETTSEAAGDIRLKQIQDAESKCTLLEKEREEVRGELNSLRSELRQARRHSSELQRAHDVLQSRFDALKETTDVAKTELQQARAGREEFGNSLKNVMHDLDTKKMEIDHLNARIQVLNATIARMKSDNLLLQEAASQAEIRAVDSRGENEEINRLTLKLQTQESKLQSITEVYHSQQRVLCLSQSLESQLLRFVEDILAKADDAFDVIFSHASSLEQLGNRVLVDDVLNEFDISGPDPALLEEFRSCLKELCVVLPQKMEELEEKHEQLRVWKHRRSLRVPENSTNTPDVQRKRHVDSPGVLEALEKVKEVLSPDKVCRSNASTFNDDYLQKIIQSLESQIDGLLSDLKSANEALRAKDQLFADMELLVTHHESDKEALEKKLKSTKSSMQQMDLRLKEETYKRLEAEKEISEVRSALGDAKCSPQSITSTVRGEANDDLLLAGQSLVRFFETRDTSAKSTAFRRWACHTCANRAAATQDQTAEALALQLETTREKLNILKRHLKKSRRRGGGGGRNACSTDPGLDRIVEGNDHSEEERDQHREFVLLC